MTARRSDLAKQRICKRCGAVFDRVGEEYFCRECAAEARRKSVVRTRICQQCGGEFLGGPRAWYCHVCRRGRQAEQARRHKKMGTARPLGSIDNCTRCGKEYIVNGSRQKYCPDCADEAVKEVVRPLRAAYNQANRDALYAHKHEMRNNARLCVICGQPIIDQGGKITCSDQCARKLRAQNQASADVRRGRRKNAEPRIRTAPQSGIPGITWHSKAQKWQVTYRKTYIGLFADIETAAAALDAAKAKQAPAPD